MSVTDRVRRVAVLGLGKVGTLVAEMLEADGFEVHAADARPDAVEHRSPQRLDVTDPRELERVLSAQDAVVSCLPYQFNAEIARVAHAAGVHYFDLTEDVPTSQVVQQLARDATSALVPHCGLAPGFVCVVGGWMAGRLNSVEHLALRVGALPRAPNNSLGYAFNWSAAGVVNECLNLCEVLAEHHVAHVPALGELEPLIVDGVRYEAFSTSGGLGTMCSTYAGRIRTLNYKSIRYPGHCDLMRFFLRELRMGDARAQAEEILSQAYPPVRDDVVLVYVAADGLRDGRRAREEFVRVLHPKMVAGRERTSIAWTTAAGVVSAVELLAAGELPQAGLVRQEDIPLDALLRTRAGSLLAGDNDASRPLPDSLSVALATT